MTRTLLNILAPCGRSFGGLLLGWLSLGGGLSPLPALAQDRPANPSSSEASSSESSSFVFVPPPPPKDQGAPSGRRQGGASRGSCKDYAGLTALVPVQNEQVRGLTASQQPMLWFYLPAPIGSDLETEFVLQDSADNFVYRTELNLETSQPGFVSVALEDPISPLEADRSYQWTMTLYCDPKRPSASVYVTGGLEFVDSPMSALARSPLEQAAQSASDGIWFDSLATLGELRQADPGNPDYDRAWAKLLEQIGLETLASAPLL